MAQSQTRSQYAIFADLDKLLRELEQKCCPRNSNKPGEEPNHVLAMNVKGNSSASVGGRNASK